MTPKEFLENYLQMLWDLFSYDIEVMSQTWMYGWLLIPAIAYFIFMCFKWVFLLTPFLIPFKISRSILRSIGKALRNDKE